MSARANPAIIGAFVLGACIVLVAGLVLWGGTAMFKPRLRYVMFFDTAVSGLQKGAAVQLRGVRVGQVTDVQVGWGTSLIAVYIEFEPDLLKGVPQGGIDPAIRAAIRDRALRAQLRMQSFVTGVLYIAIDDFPGTPIVLHGLDKAVPELPTVPTTIEVWTAKLEKIADALATLPLDELARSMISTIDEARRILKSPEVARSLKSLDVALAESRDLVRHADELVTNVNAQVGPLGSDARATLKSAQAALAQVPALVEDVRRVVAKVDTHADPLLTSLQKTSDAAGVTLERAQVTLTGVDGALNQDSPLGYELLRTLREVKELSRSLGSLADYLERNPDAVIYGVRRPVVKEGR
jgi:paraquat-inducible protein B